jgi:hypothetical protein
MQVAGIRRVGTQVEMIEVSGPRPLASDEVLVEGTWAPRLIAQAGLLARKPDHVTWEAAAAFPVPALTAEQAVGDALAVRWPGRSAATPPGPSSSRHDQPGFGLPARSACAKRSSPANTPACCLVSSPQQRPAARSFPPTSGSPTSAGGYG